MASVGAVTPAEAWDYLRGAEAELLKVYAFVPQYDVPPLGSGLADVVVSSIERAVSHMPGLVMHSRVGMYDLVAASTASVMSFKSWVLGRDVLRGKQHPFVRFGFALSTANGLAVIETLLIGASEASRLDRGSALFEMGDDGRVRPVAASE